MSIEEIEILLNVNNVGYLGTAKSEGYPYIVPINFYYEQGKFLFHSGLHGKKLEYIKANPRVCFQVTNHSKVVEKENPCNFTVYYRSVIAFGNAQIIEEKKKKLILLEKFAQSFTDDLVESLDEGSTQRVALIEMKIHSICGKKNG